MQLPRQIAHMNQAKFQYMRRERSDNAHATKRNRDCLVRSDDETRDRRQENHSFFEQTAPLHREHQFGHQPMKVALGLDDLERF